MSLCIKIKLISQSAPVYLHFGATTFVFEAIVTYLNIVMIISASRQLYAKKRCGLKSFASHQALQFLCMAIQAHAERLLFFVKAFYTRNSLDNLIRGKEICKQNLCMCFNWCRSTFLKTSLFGQLLFEKHEFGNGKHLSPNFLLNCRVQPNSEKHQKAQKNPITCAKEEG